MRGIDPASALHFVLATVPEPLPVPPLAGLKCTGLLSPVSSSSEKTLGGILRFQERELANAPVSIASSFPDKGSGVPWLVDRVSWEDFPFCSVTCWEDGPAGYDWDFFPVVASSPVKEIDP